MRSRLQKRKERAPRTALLWTGLLLALLLGPSIQPIAAQEGGSGTVEGVVEIDGTPIAGAKVVIACSARSDYEAVAWSDDSGRFQIPGVPLGGFSVSAFDADEILIAEGSGSVDEDGASVTVLLGPPS